jgi:proteasome accessory factor B
VAAVKTERIFELLLCLSQHERYVTRAQLRASLEDYAASPSDEAFERMFERDKEVLRELGVPLVTVSVPDGDDAQDGYRIDKAAYGLPPLTFTADEAAALALATRVWHETGAVRAAGLALRKLEALGVDVAEAAADPLLAPPPQLAGGEAAFAPLASAVHRRRVAEFAYRAAGARADDPPVRRRLHPWGLVSRRGRWYVAGHDLDRDAPRAFRLDRIAGEVKVSGPEHAYDRPADVDLSSMVDLVPGAGGTARLRVRPGVGHGLRMRAGAVTQTGGADGWDVLEVAYADPERLADEVLEYGAAVIVDAPDAARAAVVERLRRLAEEDR